MGVKLVQLAKGRIIGTGDIHLEELVPVDKDEPTSYIQKWDCSRTANDSVRAYITGTSGNYTLHIYGTGEMADYEKHLSSAPYSTAPWASYVAVNNPGVKSIIIHEGVTYIGRTAFYTTTASHVSLTATIASTVRTLGTYSFAEWQNLTVTGGEGLRRIINSFEFWANGNTGSLSWTVPPSVRCIDGGCFAGRTFFLNNNDSYMVVGDGCLIKSNAFSASISIPQNVKSINLPYVSGYPDIFRPAMQRFTSVDLSNAASLKHLGGSALKNHSFASIDLPGTVVSLDTLSLADNTSLRKVWIPRSVKDIGNPYVQMTASNAPFANCTNSALKIFCEAQSKPDGWNAYWNYTGAATQATVVWGATHAEFEAY